MVTSARQFYCPNCRGEVLATNTFCPHCGYGPARPAQAPPTVASSGAAGNSNRGAATRTASAPRADRARQAFEQLLQAGERIVSIGQVKSAPQRKLLSDAILAVMFVVLASSGLHLLAGDTTGAGEEFRAALYIYAAFQFVRFIGVRRWHFGVTTRSRVIAVPYRPLGGRYGAWLPERAESYALASVRADGEHLTVQTADGQTRQMTVDMPAFRNKTAATGYSRSDFLGSFPQPAS